MCSRLRTVLEPQLSEVQGTLKDVTPAWLIFSSHQHQVAVDEYCNLKYQMEGRGWKRGETGSEKDDEGGGEVERKAKGKGRKRT